VASPDGGETVSEKYHGWGSNLPVWHSVSGLRVLGDGSETNEWYGRDLEIAWNRTQQAPMWPADGEPAGTGIVPPTLQFSEFRVEIKSGLLGTVLHEEVTPSTTYKYTLEQNTADNDSGTPDPSLFVRVWGRLSDGRESKVASKLLCKNPAPGPVQGLKTTSIFAGTIFEWSPSDSPDHACYVLRTRVTGENITLGQDWGPWVYQYETSYVRRLTLAEWRTYRSYPTIHIQLYELDVYSQWSTLPAEDRLTANLLKDMNTSIDIRLGEGVSGTGTELLDGTKDSGGVTIV
jgi:hypothetical protein